MPLSSESCIVDYRKIEALRLYVKQKARHEKKHPNAIWVRLRKQYGFVSYKKIDCRLLEKIARDLKLKSLNNTSLNKITGCSNLKGIMTS